MTRLEKILQHKASISKRTTISIVCFIGFFITSLLSAVQDRILEDPVTMAALGLLFASFLVLPRDYVPNYLSKFAETNEEVSELDQLRHYQKIGFMIRVVYAIGAAITVVVLPRLVV